MPGPLLISAALFVREERALIARRKANAHPFAGQWLLPMTVVRDDETAEEALRRHVRDQFGSAIGEETFAETVYLEDPDDGRRFVTNVFRADATVALRLKASGEYEDARWLTSEDIASVWMPPALRTPLTELISGAPAMQDPVTPQAQPLAEPPRLEQPIEYTVVPDNRAGWDAIAKAYQRERYGDRWAGTFMWSWGISEDDVRALDDMHGRRVLVLGCGGGQDAVALERMGAVAFGIDQSTEQIAYARAYAQRHGAANASFVEGTIEDLSRFDDNSFDHAVSAHAFDYVEHIEDALSEAARVLRGGGSLTFSVRHPLDVRLSDDAPYALVRSYWREESDWTWEFSDGERAHFRQWFRTFSHWFDLLASAGFVIERLIEPSGERMPADIRERYDGARAEQVPYQLIIKARKR